MNNTILINGVPSSTPYNGIITNAVNIYEVVRVQEEVILFAEDHFERFRNSLRIANQTTVITFEQWHTSIKQIITANKIIHSNIRFDHFYYEDGVMDEVISPLMTHYPSEDELINGVMVILQQAERSNPNAKISDYQLRQKANDQIAARQAYETLLVNHNNELTEGSRSNLFIIKNNEVYTAPDEMVLNGIMRKKTIHAIQQLHLPLKMACIKQNELSTCDALFITGTSPRVLPLQCVDEMTFSASHPLILQIREKVNDMIKQYIQDHRTAVKSRK
ncbi:MAG: aminotransferase class IV [Marinilabiliaceae bacterium]|nr:aminotransferase class IV [Marinilabiliaceae bacterium]